MTVKTTGAEFKRFYNDKEFWPEGAATGEETWHEDEVVLVDGEVWDVEFEEIPDEARVTVQYGAVYNAMFGSSETSFESYFRRWKKKQDTVSFVVECKNEDAELIKQYVKNAGGRVL